MNDKIDIESLRSETASDISTINQVSIPATGM